MATALAKQQSNLPTAPCLTLSLRQALDNLTDRLYPTGQPSYLALRPKIYRIALGSREIALLPEIEQRIDEFERYLAPARAETIAARVITLLAHFFVPDIPASLQQAMAEDWVDALSEFPFWCINDACRGHLAESTHKPTIAAIVERCRRSLGDARVTIAALRMAREELLSLRPPAPAESQ